MKKKILNILDDSVAVKTGFIKSNLDVIVMAAETLAQCLASGHKILLFGNGGSAADAQHIAAEFVNRFAFDRRPLAAVALTTDTSILTSIGNDYSYDDIFVRQILALGKPDDIAWGISTSGNSPNVVRALELARAEGLLTLGLAGGDGGKMAGYCDQLLAVQGPNTARIQETHITLGHILCTLVEDILFPGMGTP